MKSRAEECCTYTYLLCEMEIGSSPAYWNFLSLASSVSSLEASPRQSCHLQLRKLVLTESHSLLLRSEVRPSSGICHSCTALPAKCTTQRAARQFKAVLTPEAALQQVSYSFVQSRALQAVAVPSSSCHLPFWAAHMQQALQRRVRTAAVICLGLYDLLVHLAVE